MAMSSSFIPGGCEYKYDRLESSRVKDIFDEIESQQMATLSKGRKD